jgi:multiple sugar transport system substrate-binding protein
MPRGRFTVLVLVFFAVAGFGVACGSGSSDQDEQQVQLVYQDWRTAWFSPMVEEMMEKFHETHPNIRVFFTPDPKGLADIMLEQMKAGTAPDVFEGCCAYFPIWAQEGFTLDLRPYIEDDLEESLITDWDPAQYASFLTRDGLRYAVPKYHGALALYYNKDVFDEYGVTYPDDSWDHDDYLSAMGRLTHDRDGDGSTDLWGSMIDISWDRIQMHVNGWGGRFVDPNDPTRCLMAEPEAMEALEWIRARIWDDGVMASSLDVQALGTRDAFIGGRLAMVEDGSWALKDILTKADFRIGVAPFPSGPVQRVTLATTDGFGIYAGTKHPEEAWELVKFLISEDYGRAMARANFLQPARASLVDEWVSLIRDEFPEKAREVDILAFADGHINGYSVTAEVFVNMRDARRIAIDAWDRILTLGQSPLEDIRIACDQIQQAQTLR